MNPKRVCIIGSDYPAYELHCPHWKGMKYGLNRLGLGYIFVSCRPIFNIDLVLDFKPDLIIYGLRDMVANEEARHELREKLPNAKIVMWYGDLRNDQEETDCSEMDAMFVSNAAQEQFYKRKWKVPVVHYLPLGCEPIKKPVVDKRFSFPFVFIGNQVFDGPYCQRADLINRFKIDNNLTVINSTEHKVRKRIYQMMPTIYSSSKICLDVSHFTEIDHYTSIRFWEVPAFFGFALTKRFPGCDEYYPDYCRAYFDTYEEAVYKKDYYLNHEKEMKEMIEESHRLSYNHTYDLRFKQMFEKL